MLPIGWRICCEYLIEDLIQPKHAELTELGSVPCLYLSPFPIAMKKIYISGRCLLNDMQQYLVLEATAGHQETISVYF